MRREAMSRRAPVSLIRIKIHRAAIRFLSRLKVSGVIPR